MKRQTFILTLIGILFFMNQYVSGQISEGGKPVSATLNIDTEKEKIPIVMMTPVDVKSLLQKLTYDAILW